MSSGGPGGRSNFNQVLKKARSEKKQGGPVIEIEKKQTTVPERDGLAVARPIIVQ